MKIKPHQIILFDLDHTLQSPDEFRKIFKSKVTDQLPINSDQYEKAHKSYYDSLPHRRYSYPRNMLNHLTKELNVNAAELRRLHYANENYHLALFKETKNVLEQLRKTHTIGLFTEGYRDHQLRKIKKINLDQMVDQKHMYILFNKRTPKVINSLPKDCVIVDDNPEVIDQLIQRSDITPIWINRKDTTKHPKAHTIHSLKELLRLL